MVSTIKGFALACLCKAQDYHPLGDHGFPLGNNQALRAYMLGRHSSYARCIFSFGKKNKLRISFLYPLKNQEDFNIFLCPLKN